MRRWRMFITLCMSVVLICVVGAQAYAQTRASDYFKGYSVYAYQGSNRGEMDIECDIRADGAVAKIMELKKEYRDNYQVCFQFRGNSNSPAYAQVSYTGN